MKRVLLAVTLCAIAWSAVAQNKLTEDMQRAWRQTVAKRDVSQQRISSIPTAAPVKSTAKTSNPMPTDNVWFPGEWEEVQAVVMTPQYQYYPYPSQGSGYWAADPLVTGVAVYYKYSSYWGWQQAGMGGYSSEIDTSSEYGLVSLYLIDAIQAGNAQAWVRIESMADSAIVIEALQRMGLRHSNLRFIEAPGNSFWYRDCGPICFYYTDQDSIGMLDFEYYSNRALDDSLPTYLSRQTGLPCYNTSIEWEGGNCLVDGTGMVVSSDAIYETNSDSLGALVWDGVNTSSIAYSIKAPLSHQQVKDSLQALIGPRATYILPAYRYDGGTGHIDLYADMIDENQFVFSVMPERYRRWVDYTTGRNNIDSLTSYQSFFGQNYRYDTIPFPCANNGNYFSSQTQYENYTRTYSNHTFVNQLIIQPCFSPVSPTGMPTAAWDSTRVEQLKQAYPGYTFYCIDVTSFDGSGGAIHCITKQIPADNPVRILHPAISGETGNTYLSTDVPLTVIATNRSGISNVTCTYRIDSSEWQTVSLVGGDDDTFTGTLPTAGTASGRHEVEYYLSATSVNGKTVTKPMTASQGGYYSFFMDSDTTAHIAEVETAGQFGQFYPNPATNETSVRIDMTEGTTYKVSIIDALGRTMHTSTLQVNGSILYTINTSLLDSGAYTVLFCDEQGQQTARRLLVR